MQTPDCDKLGVNGVAEVTIKSNFGNALVTVVTLGIYCPVRVSWKCAKPCLQSTLDGDYDPPNKTTRLPPIVPSKPVDNVAEQTNASAEQIDADVSDESVKAATAAESRDISHHRFRPPRAPVSKPAYTAETSTAEPWQRREGVLGYSYKNVMKYKTSQIIRVFVQIKNPRGTVRERLGDMVSRQEGIELQSGDTTTFVFKDVDVSLYRYLTVSLHDYDSCFDITHDSEQLARQQIDTVYGNTWMWPVYAKTSKKTANLTLMFLSEDANGRKTPFELRKITIAIKMDVPVRNWLSFLTDNRDDTVKLILIPLFTALGGLVIWWIKRDRKRKAETGVGKNTA